MPKPTLEFFDTASAPHTTIVTKTGTEEQYVHTCTTGELMTSTILSKDPETGDATLIIVLPAGYAQGPEPLVHEFWEEVILLRGRLYDRTLGQWFGPGFYACRPPGMVHGPYDADPVEGVKQFVSIRYERRDGEKGVGDSTGKNVE